jgi:hypothetical protein
MITKETAARIWKCYQDIEVGQKLTEDMKGAMEHGDDPNPRDPFGRQRCLQLGIPCGDTGHRMFDVQPRLAISVIQAHIANQVAALAEANEQARLELEA